MKLFKWIALVVVILVLAGLFIFWMSLDRIVRSTVETQATRSLDTQTTLQGASVSPLQGTVALKKLAIASPPGFAADHIFTLGTAKVGVTYGQLRQDPVRVDQITLASPVLVLEQKDLKTNVQALMDRIPKTDQPAGADQKPPLKLIIGTLTIQDPIVTLRPGFPGLAQEIKLKLPTLTLKDIGRGEGNQNGAALKDVVMLVLTDMASKAADSDQLPPELRQLLSLDTKQLASRMKQELNVQVEKISSELSQKLGGDLGATVGNVLKNPQDLTKDPGAALQQGLGGLLNNPTSQPAATPKKKK